MYNHKRRQLIAPNGIVWPSHIHVSRNYTQIFMNELLAFSYQLTRVISESDWEIEASKTDVCCTLCSSTIRSYHDYYIQNTLGIVS